MKKIFTNSTYISMIIGTLLAIISLILLLFIKNSAYFTGMFIANILINFAVTGTILLANSKESNMHKFINIGSYLLVTLLLMVIDLLIITNTWNLNIYSNLMYVSNVGLYLALYSTFVLFMVLMSIYVIIKNIKVKATIRQKSAKQ